MLVRRVVVGYRVVVVGKAGVARRLVVREFVVVQELVVVHWRVAEQLAVVVHKVAVDQKPVAVRNLVVVLRMDIFLSYPLRPLARQSTYLYHFVGFLYRFAELVHSSTRG